MRDPGGCDCLGMVIGICRELNIGSGIIDHKRGIEIPFHHFDRSDYQEVPKGSILCITLGKITNEIDKNNAKPGNLLLFSMLQNPQHLAVLTENNTIIHCLRETGKVTETPLCSYWKKMLFKAYKFNPPISTS